MDFTQNSQPTSPALLSRVDSALAIHHKPLNLAPGRRRKATNEDANGKEHIKWRRLSAPTTPDYAIFDDTHSRKYFDLHSSAEGVIYHSQADYIEAQGQRAAPRDLSLVTVDTRSRTYDDLPINVDRSYTTSPTGDKIYHSQAEYIEAQRAVSHVSSSVTVSNHGQTCEDLSTKADRSYTTSLIGDKIYCTDARGVSSPIAIDNTHGQTYDNITPLEIPSWSTHESERKLYTFNDHKIMFEIFEEEKEKWSAHGQTYSNLPSSSSDLPPWSIRESERELYDFDTHRRCVELVEEEPDFGYEADTEDNTDIDFPEWYFPEHEPSRPNFDLQEHVQLSQIFEAEKELLKAEERLREIQEKIRLILAERDANPVISAQEEQQLLDGEETEFEESDFSERLRHYQPSDNSSPYSAPHDSDFSAGSEMPSLITDHGSITTESEKDSSPVAFEGGNVLVNVDGGEERETSVSSD